MTAAGGPRRRQDRAYSIPPRLLPPAAHVAVAVDLVVAGAGAILSARGVTLSYPVAYPGSGNKMGGSEVHGPRATTSLAPAGSPWGGA
ncbi:hypothetical protein PG984_015151 [Apiospora sp. TS-2023a]